MDPFLEIIRHKVRFCDRWKWGRSKRRLRFLDWGMAAYTPCKEAVVVFYREKCVRSCISGTETNCIDIPYPWFRVLHVDILVIGVLIVAEDTLTIK